jgi:WD40 repeat protein
MSYSSKDRNQAHKIITALKSCDIKVWVDNTDLPPGEVIESTLFQGIEKSTVFLFLISPDSVESEWCIKEINYAVKNGKRILPVYIRETEKKLIPTIIMDRHYVDCRKSQNNFDMAIQAICSAVRADYDWANYHTNLQNKVLAWLRNKEHESWLIRGNELIEAEKRISLSKEKKQEPYLTKEQERFIEISKKVERKRKRQITAVSFVGVIVIVALLIVSFVIKQRENGQTLIAQSRKIAAQALEVKGENQGLSLILALEAYKHSPTFEAKRSLMQSLLTVDSRMRVILRNQGISATFAPDGNTIAIGGLDGKIYFYDPNALRYIGKPVDGNQNKIKKIEYSNDGNLLATLDTDGKMFLWDIKTEKQLSSPSLESEKKILGFAFIPSYNWLVVAREKLGTYGDMEVVIWNTENSEYIGDVFESGCMHCDSIAAALNKDNKILIAYAEQAVLFDKETLTFIGEQGAGGLSSGTNISPDGNYFVYGQNDESSGFRTGTYWLGKVFLSDIKTKNTIELFGSMARRINDMEISQDGNTLVIGGGGDDGYEFVTVLDNFHGEHSENGLRGFSSEVLSVAISPDKKLVIACDVDGNVVIWDLTQKLWKDWIEIRLERESMDAEDYDVLTFSQDSKFVIASASSNRMYTWDLSNGIQVSPVSLSESGVDNTDNESEVISPDGTLKAVAGENTTLIDTFTGQELIQLGRAGYVKFSPDGNYLVTYGFPSHAYYPHPPTAWNININQWVDKVCQIVMGNLSAEEWEQYVGNEQYQATCPTP